MTTIERSIHVDADHEHVYRYVSDVANLPQYFDSMTSAERTGAEEVHVTAEIPGGGHREGEAWFRTDDEAERIDWGSESESSYSGWLEVTADGAGSTVRLGMQLHRDGMEDGIDRTLDALRARVEGDRSGA